MPRQIIKFQCVHCNKKSYSTKYPTIKHEKTCFFNPLVKSCITCNNFTECDAQSGSWCIVYDKYVLVKGSPISDCVLWRKKELDHDIEFEDIQ